MIVLDIPYVRSAARKKGSTYTYKRQVPAEVREALGRKTWVKTWPRGTPVSVVETEARRLAAVHDAEIAGAGMGAAGMAGPSQLTTPTPNARPKTLKIEQAIKLGLEHHNAGRLPAAKRIYQQILQTDPDQPDVLHLLGAIAHQVGKNHIAIGLIEKALRNKPVFAEAHHTLGTVFKELGRPESAVSSFRKALAIKPGYAEAQVNLSAALIHLGKKDEAVHVLEAAVEKDRGNSLLSDCLIQILNHHMPEVGARGAYAKAQDALQQVEMTHQDPATIGDETVQRIYRQCESILSSYPMAGETSLTEIARGINFDLGCKRHFKVFNTFQSIPEFCFGCYKVYVEPRTVVELIKLLLIFDSLELPADNTRKCMIEIRPKVTGAYKGYIYCNNFEEGHDILDVVRTVVGEKISRDVPVSLKRGCSEFSIAHPSYGQMNGRQPPSMTYDEAWREHEDFVDDNLIGHEYPAVFDTHNHSGMTLEDALIMRKWLEYAAAIGDMTYLKVSGTPVQKSSIERPPFQPAERES